MSCYMRHNTKDLLRRHVYSATNMAATMQFFKAWVQGVSKRKSPEDAAANIHTLSLGNVAKDITWSTAAGTGPRHWCELLTKALRYTEVYFGTDAYYDSALWPQNIKRVLARFDANTVRLFQLNCAWSVRTW
jgi:hypothetical protein